jgi:hypothetical protein
MTKQQSGLAVDRIFMEKFPATFHPMSLLSIVEMTGVEAVGFEFTL